ncbi:MAG: beta-lactamase family protein [Actinomycetota bacterium]|nr:beta-lactamase family protein [Actinomycetota bacterium]
MSTPLLASTAAHLGAEVAKAQVAGRLPSLVAGVARDGGLAWWCGRGRRVRRDTDLRPDVDTQYRIGSITKTMTAVLVLQLRDAGRIDLGDPIGRHVPHAPFGDRSVRSLLTHSSGMPSEPRGPWWERSPGVSFADLAAANVESDAVFPAGQRHHYSNLGYALLGELVARLRGCSWEQALQRHLLDPLELRRTTTQPQSPSAQGFSVAPFAQTLTDEPAHDSAAMAPAGQLWSTAADLARWAGFLLDPCDAVLAADTVAEMAAPAAATPDDPLSAAYGLGLMLVRVDDRVLVGHGGSMPGFLAGVLVDRSHGIGAVALANGTTGLPSGLLPALIATTAQHEPRSPAEWTPDDAVAPACEELLGLWHWGNTAFVVSARGSGLEMSQLGNPRAFELAPSGPDTWLGKSGYHAGETLRVVRRGDGRISHLEVATLVYTRRPYDPRAPIPGVPGR